MRPWSRWQVSAVGKGGGVIEPVTECESIEGVLVAAAWDPDGRVEALVLNALDDRELRIEGPPDPGHMALLGQRVRITGVFDDNGFLRIGRLEVRSEAHGFAPYAGSNAGEKGRA